MHNNLKKQNLKVIDYSVSGEVFELVYDKTNDMYYTNPVPKAKELFSYYKSDAYISHTDKKSNIFEKVYHFVRTITLKKKLKLITSFNVKNKTLLDIGCGTGDFLQTCLRNGWSIKGIEPNNNARKIANEKTNNNVFSESYLKSLQNECFDVITMWHVLEHVRDLENQIKTLKRLLKPSGKLVIAVPNYKSFDAEYYGKFWAAYDVPRHLWHFSRNSIKNLFEKENMSLEQVLPMVYDSYYVSLLSEKYKTGFMNPFKAIYIGWLSNKKAKQSNEYSSHIYILKHQNI